VHRLLSVGLLVCVLAVISKSSYAESVNQSVFGSQLALLTWQTWRYVLLMSFLGCVTRVFIDLKAGRFRPTWAERVVDLTSIFVVGFASGFLAFVICEFINDRNAAPAEPRMLSDLVVCAAIFSAAINREALLVRVSDWIKSAPIPRPGGK